MTGGYSDRRTEMDISKGEAVEKELSISLTKAANAAARHGDIDAYLEALRGWCRAGRDEAIRIRRGAA